MITDGMLRMMAGAALMGAATGGTAWVSMGPKQAEVTTQAMTVIQSLTQTSGAVSARQIMGGEPAGAHVDVHTLIREGYLGALPENPTEAGPPIVNTAMSEDGVARPVVQMALAGAVDLCDEIQQQANGRKAAATERLPLDRVGCVRTGGGYVAFSRI